MTFRKNALLLIDCRITCAVFIVLSLITTLLTGLEIALMCLPFVVLLELMSRGVCNEYITINEDGIMCRKKGELLWCYKWDNIAMLKKSNRFRQPSIEIITNDKMQNTKIRSPKEPYFQLSKQAKNAIQQFYKIDKSSLS